MIENMSVTSSYREWRKFCERMYDKNLLYPISLMDYDKFMLTPTAVINEKGVAAITRDVFHIEIGKTDEWKAEAREQLINHLQILMAEGAYIFQIYTTKHINMETLGHDCHFMIRYYKENND